MLYHEALGQVLRHHRHAQGKSLRQVSSKAFQSFAFLSEVELGKKQISSEYIEPLCNSLGITQSQLFREIADLMEKYEVPNTVEEFLDKTRVLQ